MEDLTGGSLSLEQRYEIEKLEGIFAGVHVYRGIQQPLSKPIWIHVIPHPSKDTKVQQNWIETIRNLVLKASQFRDPSFYEIIDFGAVDGAPFVIYERDNFHRVSGILEIKGTLEGPTSELICSNIAEACTRLDERGLSHGSINPEFVFLGEQAEVKLIHSGFGFSAAVLDELQLNSRDTLYGIDSQGNRSDAYAIACLAFEFLSGVHPFLDDEGDKVLQEPSHPAQFGAGMQFSEILFSQFDPETRDLNALIVHPSPQDQIEENVEETNSEKQNVEKIEVASKTDPKPRKNQKINDIDILRPKKGPLFWITLAIIGGLLATLFYQSMTQKNAKTASNVVRPTTLTLTSVPIEAEVSLDGKTIGITPFEIDPKMLKTVNLKIRKEGFVEQEITISSDGQRPLFNVSLKKK